MQLRNSYRNASYLLQIKIEPAQLTVWCSCNSSRELLCLHAFSALDRLVYIYDDFFKGFLPGGPVNYALRYPDYFSIQWQGSSMNISKKKHSGCLFGFDAVALQPLLVQSARLGNAPSNQSKDGTALIYVLAFSCSKRYFPALFPCLGILNKAGTGIKGFGKLLSGIGKEQESLHTEEQRVLNLLCIELYQAVKMLPGSIEDCMTANSAMLTEALELWKQAFAFLSNQPFVFSYRYYWEKNLKDAPEKKRTRLVEISREIPRLYFVLQPYKDCYKLKLRIHIGKKNLLRWDAAGPFLFFDDNKTCLFAHVQDAAVAEVFGTMENEIIVLKPDFNAFQDVLLAPLSQYYTIENLAGRGSEAQANNRHRKRKNNVQ